MLLDFTARGITLRDEERVFWRDQYNYAQRDLQALHGQGTIPVQSAGKTISYIDAKDQVLSMYRNGEIGFKYILRYLKAWLKYKLFKSKCGR